MKRFRIEEHPLFSADDVAPAVNAVVAAMEPGDQAVLSYGVYRFGGTIRIQNPNGLRYCRIALEGEYTYTGSGPALRIEGEHLDFSLQRIATGRRSDFYKTSPDDVLPTGVEVGECNYSRLDFGEIEGFEYGLKLCPDRDDTGICYTKFTFQYISYCYIPLYFGVDDGAVAWINENQFTGGRLKGYYGMVARKGARQIDEYNNNSFWNIRFEKVTKDAIFCEFSAFNSFIKPVFSEIGGFYLNQKASSKGNTFTIEAKTSISKLAFYSKGDIVKAPLTDASGAVVASELTTTNLKSAASVKKGFTLTNKKDMTAGPGTTNLPLNIGTVNVSSASGAVTLRTDANASFENNSFMLRVTGYGKAIQVNNLAGKITSAGTYKIIYMGGEWRAVKLS